MDVSEGQSDAQVVARVLGGEQEDHQAVMVGRTLRHRRRGIRVHDADRLQAFLRGRAYVIPEDVRALAPDVLRHRVVLTFEAEAEDTTSDDVIQRVLGAVRAP